MRLLSQFFTWGVTIFVVRLLSPADYGLVELAGIFVSFLAMISELGLGAAIVQHRDLDENDLKSIFGLILLVSLLLSVSLSVAAPFIAKFYNEPKLIPIIIFLSLTFMFSGFTTVPYSLLLREQHYRTIAVIDFFAVTFGSVTVFFLALYGFGVWALVANALASKVVSTVGMHLAKPFIKMPNFRFKGLLPLFIFSGNVTLSRVLWHFYSFASATLIIGKTLGKEALGIYGIALYLACLPMEKVGGIINQVAFPAFASIQNDPHLVGAHFLKAVRILTILSVPVFWGISSIAPEIIGVFLGSKWAGAVLPLQIIALVVPLRMVRNLMAPALLGLGHSKINLINETIAAGLMSVSFYFATWWGLVGVSSVWVVAFPLVFLLNLPQTARAICISPLDIFRSMWRPVLAGFVMIAGVEISRRQLPENVSMIWRMIIYITIGGLVFFAMTALTNRRGMNEVIGLMKR